MKKKLSFLHCELDWYS